MKRLLSALLLAGSLAASQAFAAAATLLTGTADTGNTPNTSDAFVPTTGDLLMVCVSVQDSVDASPTLSSSAGLTFTNIGTQAVYGGSISTVYWFVANALVTDTSSQTVTWTEASDVGGGSVIFTYGISGMSRVGTDAIRQAAAMNNRNAGAGAPAPAFSGAALTGNVVLGCLGNNSNPAGMTAPSGFTEPSSPSGDVGYITPTTGAETVFINSGFTGTTVTWGSSSATQSGSLIVELDTTSASACPSTATGGRTSVCITSIADAGDPDNILYGLSPAVVANEDSIWHDPLSALGHSVTLGADGWPVIASGGSNLTDSFDYCVDDGGLGSCGTDGTYEVTTTPVLSDAAGIATGQTTADLSVSTNLLEGTIYTCVTTHSGTPSHAQIAAGNNAADAACTYAANDATPSASQTFSATGLSAGTTYYASYGQANAAGTPLTATVVRSASFATTAAGDTTPDAFEYTDKTGQALNTSITSGALAIAGINASTIVTISGDASCQYSQNGGAYTAVEGSVVVTDTLQLKVTSSAVTSDTVSCTLTVGGVSDTWTVTTISVFSLVRSVVSDLLEGAVHAINQ